MKGPDKQALDLVEEAWASLDAAPDERGAQAQRTTRFWQRFDQELSHEEAERQQRANQRSAIPAASAETLLQDDEALTRLLASDVGIPPYTDEHKARFWQRFDQELRHEERQRQTSSTPPQEPRWRALWHSLFAPQQRLTAAIGACALMLVLASWGLQDTPVSITMQSTGMTQPAAPSQPHATRQGPPKHVAPQPKELLKHLPMLRHMAMFEHMDMLQQSPALNDPKGS